MDRATVRERFPRFDEWVEGTNAPTFRQLEDFAKYTRAPFGFFFLPEPPRESMPLPDFRTVSAGQGQSPSANLLDTIYDMQLRQAWLSEALLDIGIENLEFVGSARLSDNPEAIGREMRTIVGLDDGWAAKLTSWKGAVSALRQAIEDLGVMAVINGVVGNNTTRPLNVEEFRGFALSDPRAPLIFVNGKDSKSAQMFTLAHELAHIWLGREGVSGFKGLFPDGSDVENWCNKAAAEFLVPSEEFKVGWHEFKRSERRFDELAKLFKVSPIVAARRALDLKLVPRSDFSAFYDEYAKRERASNRGEGGDFYNNQNTRVGKLLASHAYRAAMEGRIGFKKAYELTGLHGGVFSEYVTRLGL